MAYRTLEEALARGKGRERSFCCPVHGDRHASASVNVVKGWWICYVCGAKGDTKDVVESPDFEFGTAIIDMLDQAEARIYPEGWLDQFDRVLPRYWLDRFDERTVRHFRLGFDHLRTYFGQPRPSPCYPLHNSAGQCLGVVYRQLEHLPKYMYPLGTKVSDMLFGYTDEARDFVFLVEGAADTMAAWEVDETAWALYGSQLSIRQIGLLLRAGVKQAGLALDNDTPGQLAIYGRTTDEGRRIPGMAEKLLQHGIEPVFLDWSAQSAKDLGEMDRDTRKKFLRDAAR